MARMSPKISLTHFFPISTLKLVTSINTNTKYSFDHSELELITNYYDNAENINDQLYAIKRRWADRVEV